MRKEAKIALGIFLVLFALILAGCEEEVVTPDAPFISGSFTSTINTIRWSGVYGAEQYIIYYGNYSGSSDPSTFTRLGTTKANSYSDTTTYKRYYAVKASNSAGTSGFSNVIFLGD